MSFLGFNFVPDGELGAVVSNGDIAAKQLGYEVVSDVCIAQVRVYVDGEVFFNDAVGEGKYRSAVWVEAMMAYRGKGRYETTELAIDAVAYFALRGYMGEKVCQQAIESKGGKHPFVYAVLATEGRNLDIVVEIQWKSAEVA